MCNENKNDNQNKHVNKNVTQTKNENKNKNADYSDNFLEADIELIMKQTSASRCDVIRTLRESGGDVVDCIMVLDDMPPLEYM